MPRSAPVRCATALAAAVALVAVPSAASAASVSVTAQPLPADLARPASTQVVVQNTTQKRIGGLKLTVGGTKGLKVTVAGARKGKLTRSLPALAPGKSVGVKVTARKRGTAAAGSGLTVRVTRKGKAVASGTVPIGAASTTPPPNPNTLAGRYFWGSQYGINGTAMESLWFVNDSFVFVDDPEGAWPTCEAVTEDCLPYTFDAASGVVTINGVPSPYSPKRTIEYDGLTYSEMGFLAPGTRFDTTVTYANSSGLCPLYCNYFREDLTFRADGQFVRDAVASGSGPVVDYAVVPADQRGTYEIRADRTILLAFADGKQRIETFAVYLKEDGTLDAPGEGIIMNGDGYFDIRD